MWGRQTGALLCAALFGVGAAVSVQDPPQRSGELSITIGDLGRDGSPLPGVNVRVIDERQRALDAGPTDGLGVFTTRKVTIGQTVTLEYQLTGYVKDPAQLTVRVEGALKKVSGWLILRANNTEASLQSAARTIDRIGSSGETAEEKRGRYLDAWSTIAQLPIESQGIVSAAITGEAYLHDDPSFRQAQALGVGQKDMFRASYEPHIVEGETSASATTGTSGSTSAAARTVYKIVLTEYGHDFLFGKAKLQENATEGLDRLVSTLKADPKTVSFEIEGYTDDAGSRELNERLGLERAEAVKQYLYEHYEIPLHKITVVSYGEEKPVASNATKDGRAQNRRVVVKVIE